MNSFPKILFIIGISIFSLKLSSQSLAVSDIVFAKNHTLNETEDYLSNKGYRFLGKTEYISEPIYKYVFTCISCYNGSKIQLGIIINESTQKISVIEATFENVKNQLSIRNKIKELGYILQKENDLVGKFSTSFVKGNSKFIFSTENDKQLGVCYVVTYW